MKKLKKLEKMVSEVENKINGNRIFPGKVAFLDTISDVTDLESVETDWCKELGIDCPYIFKLLDYDPDHGHASGILIKLPDAGKKPVHVFSVAYYMHRCTLTKATLVPTSIIEWYNSHNVTPIYHGYVNREGILV